MEVRGQLDPRGRLGGKAESAGKKFEDNEDGTLNNYTIPYHPGSRDIQLLSTALRPACSSSALHLPAVMGRKGRECGRRATTVMMRCMLCSVSGDERLKGLVPKR